MRFASLALIVFAAPAAAAPSISGRWLTVEKDSVVEIAPCGSFICGRIAQILKPPPGGPPRDVNNPDPALRNRPVQGMTILSGFRDAGKNWQGSIYDPRRGKNFKSYLALQPNGTLQVKGCIGFLCQTQTWTRVK